MFAHRTRISRSKRRALRPRLDVLEAREVLSTLVVTSPADSGPGTLRDAVTTAASGDTITFDPSLTGQTITLTSGRIIDFDKSLSIVGPGADKLTISGGGNSGILGFYTDAAPIDASVSGLTFVDGKDPFSGGAIDAYNANLTVTGDVFRNNATATYGQGGAVNDNAAFTNGPATLTVTIADSKFLNNTANIGGGFQTYSAIATVTNSTFDGNTAQLGAGGAIGNGSGVVSGSTFTNNTQGGGLAYFAGYAGTLDVSGSRFANNSTTQTSGGGGLEANGGAVTISGSTFTGNTVTNDYFAQGGALAAQGSTVSIANSRFEGNLATGPQSASGGAVFLLNTGNTSITGTTFKDNVAQSPSSNGGAIDRFDFGGLYPTPTFTISGSTFVGNRALGVAGTAPGSFGLDQAAGGAASIQFPGTLTITGTTFVNNQATAGPAGSNATGLARGGALEITGFTGQFPANPSLVLNNTTFLGNSATGGAGTNSGGIGEGGAIVTFSEPTTVNGGSFLNNTASAGDGGLGAGFSGAFGGAIRQFGGFGTVGLAVNGTSFVGNVARAGNALPGNLGASAHGGAIYGASPATITGATFLGNLALGANGGDAAAPGGTGGNGGDASGGAIDASNITVTGSSFIGNAAIAGRGGSGGATGTGGAGGNATGGAINAYGPLSVSDSLFTLDLALAGLGGSGATRGASGTGYGGAIADAVGPITIKRTKFLLNRATTSGNDVYGPV